MKTMAVRTWGTEDLGEIRVRLKKHHGDYTWLDAAITSTQKSIRRRTGLLVLTARQEGVWHNDGSPCSVTFHVTLGRRNPSRIGGYRVDRELWFSIDLKQLSTLRGGAQ